MKKKELLNLLVMGILLSIVLSSCASPKTPITPETSQVVLTFFGSNGPEYLTMEDVRALPATEGMGGIISSTGQITIPELYKGVALKDLVSAFGGEFDPSMGITLTAEDGYSMTYSYEQVMNGEFPAYDPAQGNELKQHDPLTAILAYERAGQSLDPIQDGILRMVVVSEKNNQVTDGHWSIKWVTKAKVDAIGQTWSLDLEGALLSTIDRGSFQSCASPGCHGVDWQDENGQTWNGIPLWLLVGEVDDADSHSDYAFNESLADSGYTVDLISSDGNILTLESTSFKLNGNIIVAYLVNNSELPEIFYPLKIVGEDIENSQQIGKIVKIIVHVPPAATLTPVMATELTGDLIITGLVANPVGLMESDLRASEEVTTTTAEHPKKGVQDYEGLRFKCLFNMAGGLDPNAIKVILTSSDGYTTEINLADLQACDDCMLAFSDTPGEFNAVMPGFQSSDWAKYVVKIEVK